MADEKPGLLKRIFSFGFGRSKKPEPAPEPAAAPELPEVTVAETAPVREPEIAEASPPKQSEQPARAKVAPDEKTKPAAKKRDKQEPAKKKSAEPSAKKEVPAAPAKPKPKTEKAQAPKLEKAKPAKEKPVTAEKAPPQTPAATKKAEPKPARPAPEPAPPAPPKTAEPKPAPEAVEPAPPVPAEPKPVPPPPPPAPPSDKTGKVTLFEPRKEREAEPQPEEAKAGWFQRLRKGLSRSSSALTENIASVLTKRRLDDDTLQDLEDLLIQADLGVETAMAITESLSDQRYGRDVTDEEVRQVVAAEIEKVLEPVALPLELDLEHRPHVILVVGVNGSGKTTTIGKMSAKLNNAGLSTLLVAGDTFRAAAIEQLQIWGERTGSPVVARELGADAAGLAFDAWQQARDGGYDIMLMDTAGRLQNKTELMAELEKIVRVLKKHDPSAPHTVLLTLDATTGQNALNQVEIFEKIAGVNGLAMTKLDGTARGGILVAISAKFKLPVYFIGVGESVDDLEPFRAKDFANAIAGVPA